MSRPNSHIYRAAFFGTARRFHAFMDAVAPDDKRLLQDLQMRACGGACQQGRKPCPCPQACQISSEEELVSIVKTILAVLCGLLALALIMSTPAHAAEAETTATIAAAADTGSTVAVVATGIGVEGNALLAHPVAFAAVAVAKLAAPRLTRDMEPETRRFALRSMTTFWGAAAVNNLALLAGAGCPPCLGVAAGVVLWVREGRREPEPITAPEADAVLALVDHPEAMP